MSGIPLIQIRYNFFKIKLMLDSLMFHNQTLLKEYIII